MLLKVRRCKSRELRAGILYTYCDCVKRNGLQDHCPRAQCQGHSACMSMPDASCCPSQFPRRFQNMTMGLDKRQMRNRCGGCPPACAPRCPAGSCSGGGCGDAACCFLGERGCCGPPIPIPPMCSPGVCPALREGGAPDPSRWSPCTAPAAYPCYVA